MRQLAMTAFGILIALGGTAAAQEARLSDNVLRIGVLTDMSGVFSENTGKGSVVAVEMAVADAGGKALGRTIEVISGDHQNKPDLASSMAREWFDRQGVDMIADLINTAVSLAVMEVAREKQRVTIVSSGSTRISEESCSPYNIQAVYNTYATSNSIATAMLALGYKKWFFVTADYSFGHSTEAVAAQLVKEAGGVVLGSVRHPVGTTDFASFLLNAQASGADVIAFANAGQDFVNATKQAREFGITGKQAVLGLAAAINDVRGLGLGAAEGLYLTEGFYWDQTPETRAFSKRFFEKMGKMPNMAQGGLYSATRHYLKAIEATKTDAAPPVMTEMRKHPINDGITHNGTLRETGLLAHDMLLLQAKSPKESSAPWDLLKVAQVIPAEKAFGPPKALACAGAK